MVRACGSVLPALTAVSLLISFAVLPRGRAFSFVLSIHHAAFLSLFLFLCAAQLIQLQASRLIRRGGGVADVAAIMRRLWALTEIAPAPIAIAIFLTGLRLIWESPVANSPSNLWLSLLIVSFSVFFFDGILGYQPIVRRMGRYWEGAAQRGEPAREAAGKWSARWQKTQLLSHCLSWPIAFALGAFRWNAPNPLSAAVEHLQLSLAFLPFGWPGVTTALVLWGTTGLLVVLGHGLSPRLSRTLRQATRNIPERSSA